MGQFTTNLKVTEANGFEARLLDPLVYRSSRRLTVIVPGGFVTDFASVPRLLWPLCPPHGYSKKAAVVHDFLYTQDDCARVIADAVFLTALRDCGVPWWRRSLMYAAVRCFGWLFRKAS